VGNGRCEALAADKNTEMGEVLIDFWSVAVLKISKG
jgi:hypothetical protein